MDYSNIEAKRHLQCQWRVARCKFPVWRQNNRWLSVLWLRYDTKNQENMLCYLQHCKQLEPNLDPFLEHQQHMEKWKLDIALRKTLLLKNYFHFRQDQNIWTENKPVSIDCNDNEAIVMNLYQFQLPDRTDQRIRDNKPNFPKFRQCDTKKLLDNSKDPWLHNE